VGGKTKNVQRTNEDSAIMTNISIAIDTVKRKKALWGLCKGNRTTKKKKKKNQQIRWSVTKVKNNTRSDKTKPPCMSKCLN